MTLTSLRQRLFNSSARLRRDEDGVAAIEFAILAPIMILMYFGLAEMATAISVDRRISHGANVAGDLATQTSEKSTAEVEELLSAAIRVLGGDTAKITMQLDSVTKDSDGNIVNQGKIYLNKNASSIASFDASTLDDKILSENSGIVVTRIGYDYSPITTRYFNSDVNLQETFMLKPRRSDAVTFGGSTPHEVTCTATTYKNVSCTAAAVP